MATRTNKQYVVAGVWMLIGLFAAVAIFAAVGSQLDSFKSKVVFQAEFPLSEGATGLKPGSAVRVGGLDQGRVENIAFDDVAFPSKVLVDFSLPKEIRLYRDPEETGGVRPTFVAPPMPAGYDPRGRRLDLRLEQPILGTGSVLNLVSVGWPRVDRSNVLQPASTFLEKGRLRGVLAPSLLSQAGIDKSEIDKLKLAFTDLQQFTGKLNADYDSVRGAVVDGVKDARATIGELKAAVEENRLNIRAAIEKAPAAIDNFNTMMVDGRKVVADVQAAWPAWRDDVTASLKNAQRFVASLDPETGELYKKISGMVQDGRDGLAAFKEAAAKADGLLMDAQSVLAENAPELRLMIANSRLASDQLKLTLAEVRRNPWKLLYQPGRKELQQDLLFMSSRNYAEAVSDLRGVTASLESVTASAKASGREADAKQAADMKARLQEAFGKYEAAEKELLERLVKEAK